MSEGKRNIRWEQDLDLYRRLIGEMEEIEGRLENVWDDEAGEKTLLRLRVLREDIRNNYERLKRWDGA